MTTPVSEQARRLREQVTGRPSRGQYVRTLEVEVPARVWSPFFVAAFPYVAAKPGFGRQFWVHRVEGEQPMLGLSEAALARPGGPEARLRRLFGARGLWFAPVEAGRLVRPIARFGRMVSGAYRDPHDGRLHRGWQVQTHDGLLLDCPIGGKIGLCLTRDRKFFFDRSGWFLLGGTIGLGGPGDAYMVH